MADQKRCPSEPDSCSCTAPRFSSRSQTAVSERERPAVCATHKCLVCTGGDDTDMRHTPEPPSRSRGGTLAERCLAGEASEPWGAGSPSEARRLDVRSWSVVRAESHRDWHQRRRARGPGAEWPATHSAGAVESEDCSEGDTWHDVLLAATTGLPMLWWRGAFRCLRPVGLSFGATGRASAHSTDSTGELERFFTRNSEYVYEVSRAKDGVVRNRWQIPRLWIQSFSPILPIDSLWAPIEHAMTYVEDAPSGLDPSLVFPFGQGGEFGLARLRLGDGKWDINARQIFNDRVSTLLDIRSHLRIASHGPYLFVSYWRAGVGLWLFNSASGEYEFVGLLRVPQWAPAAGSGSDGGADEDEDITIRPASGFVTDLFVWRGPTARYLVAAIQWEYPGRDNLPPNRALPRTCMWQIGPELGAEARRGSVGIEQLDGRWDPALAASSGHVPTTRTIVFTRASHTWELRTSGATVSSVAGEPVLWVESNDGVDSIPLPELRFGLPGVLSTSPSLPTEVREGFVEENVRVVAPTRWRSGVGISDGEVLWANTSNPVYCGAPKRYPVSTRYPKVSSGFFLGRPAARGPLVVGTATSLPWWLLYSLPSGELVKIGELQQFIESTSGMSEKKTRGLFTYLGEKLLFVSSAKSQLARMDFEVPIPYVGDTGAIAASVLPAASPGSQGLQVVSGPECMPYVYPSSKYESRSLQSVAKPELPGSPRTIPPSPTGARASGNWPANSGSSFAEEGLPPNVGWGYGGEWMDACSFESESTGAVAFLADRGTGAVFAHASGAQSGAGLDVFPGYDPYGSGPYQQSLWPCTDPIGDLVTCCSDPTGFRVSCSDPAASPDPNTSFLRDVPTAKFAGYFAGRNRIPGCRSVASLPYPGVSNAVLVASLGYFDARMSLFLAPFSWSPNEPMESGRFVFGTRFGMRFPFKFPLNPYPISSPEYAGRASVVRAVQLSSGRKFLVGFINSGNSLPPADLAIIEPTAFAKSGVIELVSPGPLPSTLSSAVRMWSLPRTPDGRLDVPFVGPVGTLPPQSPTTILDIREGAFGRVYLLISAPPEANQDEEEEEESNGPDVWVLTLAKVSSGSELRLVHALRLDTHPPRQEIQRLKVSHDGRWLTVTLGRGELIILHGNEQQYPRQVGGLRGGNQRWEGWLLNSNSWEELASSYTRSNRGSAGTAHFPVWPLPVSPVTNESDLLSIPQQPWLRFFGTSSHMWQTSGGDTLLAIDTGPISVWALQEELLGAQTPLVFLGCIASEGSGRMRATWETSEAVFFLGDEGTWAIPRCAPLTSSGTSPVSPAIVDVAP